MVLVFLIYLWNFIFHTATEIGVEAGFLWLVGGELAATPQAILHPVPSALVWQDQRLPLLLVSIENSRYSDSLRVAEASWLLGSRHEPWLEIVEVLALRGGFALEPCGVYVSKLGSDRTTLPNVLFPFAVELDIMEAKEVGERFQQVMLVVKFVMHHPLPQKQMGLAISEAFGQHLDRILVGHHRVTHAMQDDSWALHLLD